MTKRTETVEAIVGDGAADPNVNDDTTSTETADTDGPIDPGASAVAVDPDPMTRADLIAAMDAHETEGERLDAAMAELGLTAKDVKAIRKAEKASAAARKVLAELMGEGA